MAKHTAPVTGLELHRLLTDFGCEVRPATGGNAQVAVVAGVEIRVPLAQRKAEVPDSSLTAIARALGCSRKDVLDVLGRPAVKGGKPKAKRQHAGPPPVPKSYAVGITEDLRNKAKAVEDWLRVGVHGGDLYRRVYDDVHRALDLLADYPLAGDADAEAETYARLSPDDAGYRPTAPDSLTTGAARVTGVTATAAKARKTFTKWQWEERQP